MELNIDGNNIKNMDDLHNYIVETLSFDKDDYGYNLDALWDELSSYGDELEINIIDAGRLSINLGDDYGKIISIFMNLSLDNKNIDMNLNIK